MTAPGLAMFYGGLVRKKNVLGVMMQCVFLMGLMTVIWALYGYSLAFGGAATSSDAPEWSHWIGNADHLFLTASCSRVGEGKAVIPTHPALAIPRLTHMLFQGMFFIITPALICGAFAERMKFSTMVVFMILWGTLVYCHWRTGCGAAACWRSASPMPLLAARWILPAARSCISAPAFRHWSVRCWSASGWALATIRCRRII